MVHRVWDDFCVLETRGSVRNLVFLSVSDIPTGFSLVRALHTVSSGVADNADRRKNWILLSRATVSHFYPISTSYIQRGPFFFCNGAFETEHKTRRSFSSDALTIYSFRASIAHHCFSVVNNSSVNYRVFIETKHRVSQFQLKFDEPLHGFIFHQFPCFFWKIRQIITHSSFANYSSLEFPSNVSRR